MNWPIGLLVSLPVAVFVLLVSFRRKSELFTGFDALEKTMRGGLAALLSGLILNVLGNPTFYAPGDMPWWRIILLSPVVEETARFTAVRTLNRKSWDYYLRSSLCLGSGYAMLEQVSYGAGFGLATGLARMLTTVPLHVAITVIVSSLLWLSREQSQSIDGITELAPSRQLLIVLVAASVHAVFTAIIIIGVEISRFVALLSLPFVAMVIFASFRVSKKAAACCRE
jgi:RsiW-degrading membrane proteinase PrsW (M82 family)